MKYMKEVCLILAVTVVAEILYDIVPLPIPASIYGLCLMMLLLMSGVLKQEYVEKSAHFLVEIMPLMFIPAAVGIMVSWEDLLPVLLPVSIIVFLSTAVVMVVSGKVTSWVMEKGEKHD